MNGFIKRTLLVGGLVAGCCSVAGCTETYNELVDQCWPQRYTAIAREEVEEPLATQADNGLVLDQTIWNHHFEQGKEVLHPSGQAALNRLARRRPSPVTQVFVQTSQDVPVAYTPEKPGEYTLARTDLDNKRSKAVKDYLAAIQPGVSYTVTVHNPSPVGMNANEAAKHVSQALGGDAKGTVRKLGQEEVKNANSSTNEKETKETKETTTK